MVGYDKIQKLDDFEKEMKTVFEEFINGKKFHKLIYKSKKYPVIPIIETKDVFGFLSVPNEDEESHLIIIPKKKYEFIEEVPKRVLLKLFSEIQNFSRILRNKYGGVRILLNNGRLAEQYVPHVHFHLIPINKSKKCAWLNLGLKKFERLSKELLKYAKS